MGILDGKRILVAGVTMDNSIGFAVAKVAQEQGATVLISNFGRALGITKRIAKRLPVEPPVLELDVTNEEHLARLPELVREHVDGLDGVVHSIAYGNPETLLGGKFLEGPWDDVAQALQVSAYSLKSLAQATRPLMSSGGSVVGLTTAFAATWSPPDRFGPWLPRPSPVSRTWRTSGAIGHRSVGTTPTRTPPPGRSVPCSRTSSRPPPEKSCTSTEVFTPWARESVPSAA